MPIEPNVKYIKPNPSQLKKRVNTNRMSTEELLKPRYKVIAAYPEMAYRHAVSVGDILTDNGRFETTRNQDGDARFTFEWESFPHLFKPLQWWEEREEKDMPEYIKVQRSFEDEPCVCYKHRKNFTWLYNDGDLISVQFGPMNRFSDPKSFLPATLEEYTQYNQQKSKS